MVWDRVSDTLEICGEYSIERRIGHWMTFVPDKSLAIYVSPLQTFSSNSAERDREVARRKAEEHFNKKPTQEERP